MSPTDPTPRRSDDELLALVHRKAARIRHRRQFAALGASALVVLLLAGGIALAGNGGGGNKRTIRAAAGPTTTPAPEETTTIETTTTSPPTTVAVTPAPTTTTSRRPKMTTTTTTWPTFPGGGLTADVTADPQDAPVGTSVHFVVHVRDDSGSVTGIGLDYGDGTSAPSMATDYLCLQPSPQSPARPAPPTDKTYAFDHVYAQAGTYVAVAHVETGGCPWDTPEHADPSTRVTMEPSSTSTTGGP